MHGPLNLHICFPQVSRTFDPFLFLSLPLPTMVKLMRIIFVYVVRSDPDKPVLRVRVCRGSALLGGERGWSFGDHGGGGALVIVVGVELW